MARNPVSNPTNNFAFDPTQGKVSRRGATSRVYPPPAMRSAVTQYGVTFNFSTSLLTGQYCNGDWWALNPGGGVTITSITPASANIGAGTFSDGVTPWAFSGGTGGRVVNGTMVNPGNSSFPGNLTGYKAAWGSKQGYDSLQGNSNPLPYDPTFNVDPGITGSSLVIADEASVVKTIYNASVATTGRAALSDAVVLTVVNAQPAAKAFRPAVSRTSKTSAWTEDQLDYTVFPNLAPPASATNIDTAISAVSRMGQFQYWYYLGCRNIMPTNNHPEYGRDWAFKLQDAAMLLCLSYSRSKKRDLAVYMTQHGIDLYGRLLEGAVFPDNGGANQGKKVCMVIAAAALNDAGMKTYCDGALKLFTEDRDNFTVSLTDVGISHYTGDGRPRAPYTRGMIGTPEWGEQHMVAPTRDGSSWLAFYRGINLVTFLGTSVAMRLITGAKAVWANDNWFDYCDRAWSINKSTMYTQWANDGFPPSHFFPDFWVAYRNDVGTTPPTVTAAGCYSTELWINYSSLLDPNNVPPTSSFAVTENGASRTVTAVSVYGKNVILTLGTAITGLTTVLVSYTPGATKIQDVRGNLAAAAANHAVTNSTPTVPILDVAPAISGTAAIYQTLTCTDGTWEGAVSYVRKWQSTTDEVTWTDVAGATGNTYTCTAADNAAGLEFRFVITATNPQGSVTAYSDILGPVDVEAIPTGWPLVAFDGTTYLQRASSGGIAAADGALGTIGIRFRAAAAPGSGSPTIFSGSTARVQLSILTTGALRLRLFNSGGTEIVRLETTGSVCDNAWHDILFSWDVSQTTAANGRSVYVDGVSVVNAAATYTVNALQTVNYSNASSIYDFGGLSTTKATFDCGYFWFDGTTRIDITDPVKRALFNYDEIGLLGENVMGGTKPRMFLVGVASDWNAAAGMNRGSGFPYIKQAGAVTDISGPAWPE